MGPNPFRINQRWIETPDGYAWAPVVQPVKNLPNLPLEELPDSSLGPGMWDEVSVPFVDLIQENPPARAPWLINRINSGMGPRWYYSQIAWVDGIKKDPDGQIWYRLNERYGYGDLFWGKAEALRPLTSQEQAPLSPEIENKRILVNITTQTLSCFEDELEVYFARVSTGALYNINWRPSRLLGDAAWGTSHLAKRCFTSPQRWLNCSRLGSASRWLDLTLCGKRCCNPFHLLAQQLRSAHLERLR